MSIAQVFRLLRSALYPAVCERFVGLWAARIALRGLTEGCKGALLSSASHLSKSGAHSEGRTLPAPSYRVGGGHGELCQNLEGEEACGTVSLGDPAAFGKLKSLKWPLV